MTTFYREAEADLARWFARKRRKPLVIRGARQVGKSTLVRRFAETRGLTLACVNLEQHRLLERVFEALNVASALAELEQAAGTHIGADTLLFLDELQATPAALPLLRYLYEERPDLPVIAAGSLLEFVLARHDFAMPVGRVDFLYLGPVGFREYLRALGEDLAVETLATLAPGQAPPATLHRKLLELQRGFMLVGGMPEAVSEYAEARSLAAVVDCQQSILATYRDDFAKYGRGAANLLRLQAVFDYIPAAVGQKLKYTHISRHDRARDLQQALQMLIHARIVTPVYHSDCSGLPLAARRDATVLKCLFVDIGLVCRALGLDAKALRQLDERRLVNEGGLAEQFVGQHLAYASGRTPSLHYWLREAKAGNAEVDFVTSSGDWIVPIEVKAGKTGSLKSLHEYVAAKSPALAVRFDLNPPSLHEFAHRLTRTGTDVRVDLLSLPLYLVEELPRMIDQLR